MSKQPLAGTLMRLLANMVLIASRRAGRTETAPEKHLEVERKFQLLDGESNGLPSRLKARGFASIGRLTMTDTFLPRAKEGDMNRIRVESDGKTTRRLLTMKDWVVVSGEKERREEESEIGLAASLFLRVAGRLLNRSALPSFSKTRDLYSRTLGEVSAVVSIDQVTGLGRFSGWYLEIEVIVPIGGNVHEARDTIRGVMIELLGEEREFVKRSYQDMLSESVK